MTSRRPCVLDKILIEGEETTVLAVDLFQTEAPLLWKVTNSAGVELKVEWRKRVWGVPGKAVYLAKPPAPKPSRNDLAGVKAQFRPAVATGPVAVEIKLSSAVLDLHRKLDEQRDLYDKARNRSDADAMENIFPRYEQCILAVDQADPGFFLGRRDPLKAAQFAATDASKMPVSTEQNAAPTSEPAVAN